ncbi:MAG: hypothetical protein IPP30_07780 [Flavobacterium sp.]|nr:hypothetical protein [Flavobacterium sp.]
MAAVINGTIDYLTNSIKNQITGGSGYTVNKMRIFIPETRSGATIFDANSYNSVLAGQQRIEVVFLAIIRKNGKCSWNTVESTEDLPMSDTVHYTTLSYDTLGQREANYFMQFINE